MDVNGKVEGGVDEKAAELGEKKVPWLLSCRVALALVGFLGFINLYALRVNLSVAMVCMINRTALSTEDVLLNVTYAQDTPEKCYAQQGHNTTYTDGEFVWDKPTQGWILGAFFWGYLITQIPGGWLSERFGGKVIFGWFMLATAVATLLTPLGARTSPWMLVALRIVQGLGEGVVFPAMHCLWSKWAPPLERSKLFGFTSAGAQIGNVLTLPISGLLCDYGFDGGWASIFYLSGAFGVLWFVLWMFITYNSPATHPRISKVEREYIEKAIGASTNPAGVKKGTPWLKFFTSLPFWAIIVAHTCATWGTYTLLTNIPTYMKEVLKFDIKSNGLFSAMPYVVFWLCINLASFVADTMRSKGWKTATVRKIMYSLGTLLPAAFLVGTGYISCANPYIAVALLSLGMGFNGFQYPGMAVNHVDIAPPFAGTLFGISNTVASLSGILAPYVTAMVTKDQTQGQWQIVFYISAVIYTVGAVFYMLFAQGELQDWVKPYMYDELELKQMKIISSSSDDNKVKQNGDAEEGKPKDSKN